MPAQITIRTRITGCIGEPALRYAADRLARDIRNVCLPTEEDGVEIALVTAPMETERFTLSLETGRLLVRASDKRGFLYGLIEISRSLLHVTDLWFWNDQAFERREAWPVPDGYAYASSAPAVRYRGWFINDEVLLDPWKNTEEERREVWRMAFEAILRCGGNMVIAGTDRCNDGLDMLASDMGLILTQHHAELLGAEMFGRVWPDLKGSYRLYPEKFEALWRAAARRYAGREVIYAVGFRGQGDGAFWSEDSCFDTDAKRGAEISRIIRRQMEIVREVSPNARFCTNLYGEMMALYRKGYLTVPEDVIKIWADNGYGRMVSRRQGDLNPRVDSMPNGEKGENGIYYHASFYDLQAANHITQLQIPPKDVARELEKVLMGGANSYWLVNSGSIKPHVYILDLIRALWHDGRADADAHAAGYAARYFGDPALGALLTSYANCAVRYGDNADDLAGDQYYHHVARALCCRWMRGETDAARELRWALPGDSLFAQARQFALRCGEAIPKWEKFLFACEAARASALLSDTLAMNARVHLSGCRMAVALGRAMTDNEEQRYDQAFFDASLALEAAREGYSALRAAEHDGFIGYYQNDCFTNLSLTCDVLTALRAWLRACHDGPNYWGWERQYLMSPAETRICLQTHKHCQLSDEALFQGMKAKKSQ